MLRNCWGGVGWGGVGWGWWHSLNLHTWWMLRNCWGGVGWGRDDDILWTWTHGGCYAHMVDATQLLGWGGLGWGWWHSLNLHKKHGWLTGDVENASKLEEAEERTAWYEPCQEKKGSECGTGKGQGCSELVIYSYNRFTSIKLKISGHPSIHPIQPVGELSSVHPKPAYRGGTSSIAALPSWVAVRFVPEYLVASWKASSNFIHYGSYWCADRFLEHIQIDHTFAWFDMCIIVLVFVCSCSRPFL